MFSYGFIMPVAWMLHLPTPCLSGIFVYGVAAIDPSFPSNWSRCPGASPKGPDWMFDALVRVQTSVSHTEISGLNLN